MAVIDDTEEYEVLFEVEDDVAHQVTCSTLITDCFNVNEEALVLEVQSIKQWGVGRKYSD